MKRDLKIKTLINLLNKQTGKKIVLKEFETSFNHKTSLKQIDKVGSLTIGSQIYYKTKTNYIAGKVIDNFENKGVYLVFSSNIVLPDGNTIDSFEVYDKGNNLDKAIISNLFVKPITNSIEIFDKLKKIQNVSSLKLGTKVFYKLLTNKYVAGKVVDNFGNGVFLFFDGDVILPDGFVTRSFEVFDTDGQDIIERLFIKQ